MDIVLKNMSEDITKADRALVALKNLKYFKTEMEIGDRRAITFGDGVSFSIARNKNSFTVREIV
jgi:hypothetical protein